MKPATSLAALALLCACAHGTSRPLVATMPRTALAVIQPRARIEGDLLERWAATGHGSLGAPHAFVWTRAGDAVLFLRSGPRSSVGELFEQDPVSGRECVLATSQQLLGGQEERLSPEERARRERARQAGRGIASFALAPDEAHVLIPLSGRLFLLERASGRVRELAAGAAQPAIDPRFSPDGRLLAVVRGGELAVIDVATGVEHAVTHGADAHVTHGVAEFIAQEEMDRPERYWWSPDGTMLAYEEADATGVERLHVADPLHPEQPPEANVFPRAGHANVRVRVGLIAVTGGPTTWIAWDSSRDPYLAAVRWNRGAPLTLVVQSRAQDRVTVLTADASGRTSVLLTEHDDAWVELDPSVPRWLPDGSGFLWSTDRDGPSVLELRGRDGHLVRPLTDARTNYRRLLSIDPTRACAYIEGGEDSSTTQLVRVPLDASGGAPVTVSHGRGEHVAVSGATLRVHRASTLDHEPTWTIERMDDGAVVGTVRSTAESLGIEPRITQRTVGPHAIRAVVVKPRAFDPHARYPVLVAVYGGAGSRMVNSAREHYVLAQWMADHGYLVVSFDGRGTPARGRAWSRALRGHLGEVPLADQVEALQALGAEMPAMDLSRVGVFGWSFGGYLAGLAVLQRPDVFHAAVAGAPVTDWRDYDTHYTERYLGQPDAAREDYDRASLVTHAASLTRPLLIVHGTADDNVYFVQSMRLVDALFRAGRPFGFLPLAGFTHMVPDPDVTRRLYDAIMAFFAHALTRTP